MLSNNEVIFEKFLNADAGVKAVNWRYKGTFIIGSNHLPVIKISTDTVLESYLEGTVGLRFITIHMARSEYARYVYQYKDQLLFRLEQQPTDKTGAPIEGAPTLNQTFAAYICDPTSPYIISNLAEGGNASDEDDLDSWAEVVLQLVDLAYLAYEAIDVGGVVVNTSSKYQLHTILRGLMTKEVRTLDNQRVTVSADVVASDNTRIYPQLLIPHGKTKLPNLPHFFHYKYGLYASGLGYFYKSNRWWVFPLLNAERFYKPNNGTLTIIILERDRIAQTDSSYIREDNNTVIFVTGEVAHLDFTEHAHFHLGNGVRYAVRSNLPEAFVDNAGGKINIAKGLNKKEVIVKQRLNGPNRFLIPEDSLSDNPFEVMGDLTQALSNTIKVTWDFANPQILYPGMPVKVLYRQKGKVVSMLGGLMSVKQTTMSERIMQEDTRYITRCDLTLQCHPENYV